MSALTLFRTTAMLLAPALALLTATVATEPTKTVWEKPIAPGLIYREELDVAGHHSIHALRVSLRSTSVRLTTALAGRTTYEDTTSTGRAPVSKIVADEGALAGVNGDFFSMERGPSGDPLGLTVREGRLLSTPSRRVCFGWGPQDVRMAPASLVATIQSPSGTVRIDGINRKCPQNSIVLDTPDVGIPVTDGPAIVLTLKMAHAMWSPSTVLRGSIEKVSTESAPSPLSADEAVLIGRGLKGDELGQLRPGTTVTISLTTIGFDWEKIDTVIGGGPMLVKGGAVLVDGAQEGFGTEFYNQRHPRTAIGRTADNQIWLVAVDGRQETGDGETLDELAQEMVHLGCVDAMNLDGGGSTTMNVTGVTVNRPSDGSERPVADAVIVTGPAHPASSEKLLLTVPPSMSLGQTAQLSISAKTGAPVPSVDIVWGCTGSCFIDQSGLIRALKPGLAEVEAACHGQKFVAQISVAGALDRSINPR